MLVLDISSISTTKSSKPVASITNQPKKSRRNSWYVFWKVVNAMPVVNINYSISAQSLRPIRKRTMKSLVI